MAQTYRTLTYVLSHRLVRTGSGSQPDGNTINDVELLKQYSAYGPVQGPVEATVF